MSTRKQRKAQGKAHLQRIIDLCRTVEERGIDPFLVETDDVLSTIREYFPEWGDPEERCLDAEALNELASTIKLQGEWVKHRSTSLYTDPFLIEDKLQRLPKEEIAAIFLKSWRPIVEFEQLSPNSFMEATQYWQSLAPINERWQMSEGLRIQTETATREELLEQQIIAEREFSQKLEAFWEELKQKAEAEGKIEYWSFIGAPTYKETIKRAYLTSFLITYGYATLDIDWFEEIIHIKPFNAPVPITGKKQAVSLPIPITVEDWQRWREGAKI